MLVLASLGAALWWTLSTRMLTGVETVVTQLSDTFNPWSRALQEVPLWVFQSLAAFPLRDDPAPMVVYACGLLAFGIFLGMSLRYGDNRHRWALAACALISLSLPYAVTVTTVSAAGTFWQGRYTLPYAVGVSLLAGSALDRARSSPRLRSPFLLVGSLCLAVSHVVSVANVARNELATSPLSGDPRWVTAPVWTVCVTALVGVALWSGAVVYAAPPGGFTASRDETDLDVTAADLSLDHDPHEHAEVLARLQPCARSRSGIADESPSGRTSSVAEAPVSWKAGHAPMPVGGRVVTRCGTL